MNTRSAIARVALFAIAVAVSGSVALAQSGGGYVIQKQVIGAGGTAMSGGAYALTGTVGQHAAAIACANTYRVYSGFWPGTPPTDVIFRNGFEAGC